VVVRESTPVSKYAERGGEESNYAGQPSPWVSRLWENFQVPCLIPKIRFPELRDVPSFGMFSSPLIYLSSYKKTKGREQTDGNPTHCPALGLAWRYQLIESFGPSFNYKNRFVGMIAPKLLPTSNERSVMDWTRARSLYCNQESVDIKSEKVGEHLRETFHAPPLNMQQASPAQVPDDCTEFQHEDAYTTIKQ